MDFFERTNVPQVFSLPETSLKDYWNVLVRRRVIVLSICLATTLVVGVLSFMMTPLYKASATIIVESEDSDILNPSSNSTKGMSFDIFENYLETQMSLIMSRNVAGKVFDELNLQKDSRYHNEANFMGTYLKRKWQQFLGFFSTESREQAKKTADPLQLFLKDIQLQRLKGTRAIKISVLHPNPERAAQIANQLAERYSQDNLMRRALTFIRNQRMAALNADYLRLQSRYDYLSNLYGPKHLEMVTLKNEIRALSDRIDTEKSKNIAANMTAEAAKPASKEEEKLLQDILRQIQESSVFSSSQMNNIVIVDPAIPPAEVSVPNKKLNILIGFLAGLGVGVFFAFLINYLDDTVKTEEELRKMIVPYAYLGSVPYDKYIKGFRRIANIDRLMAQRPMSGSAEAYRLLRVQLQWLLKREPGFREIASVSSLPEEGKSTITSNLAIAFSQLDMKILIVDADIRRGRLSRTYKVGKKKGLRQYLSEDIPIDSIIQKTKIPNLWVVTAGESRFMGSELLSSPKMTDFIQAVRKKFDLVFYDTPPVTLISDTSVLLSQLDAAIFVARAHTTPVKMVPKSLSMIQGTNTNLLGVIFNSTPMIENKYYHLYYKEEGVRTAGVEEDSETTATRV